MVRAERDRGPLVERWLAVPVVIGLAYSLIFLGLYGYLPAPYFYVPSDTFMDFSSPATFAYQGGAYDSFATVYPPLSFVLLKLVSWGPCYGFNPSEEARNCDTYGISWLILIYVINSILIWRSFRKLDGDTAIPRTLALCAGLPMTYALERGNVMLFCFTCLILAYGPLVRSARWRWLFAGLAVNFKFYLIGTIFAQLLKHRWRWFEGALIASLVIYLITYAIYGAGSPREIYANITVYADSFEQAKLPEFWYPSSLQPISLLLQGDTQVPAITALGSQAVVVASLVVRSIVLVATLTIVAAAAAAWWRPGAVPMHRLILLSIGIALINFEAGGYSQMILLFFAFFERWRGIGRPVAIIIAYTLCIALDFPIAGSPEVVRDSYLGGRTIIAEYSLGLGTLLRPLLVVLMLLSLALVTIRDVWAHARTHGWRSPLPSRHHGISTTQEAR